MIDIAGLDKAEVLAALVNGAKPLGMGRLHDDGRPMTKEDAQVWIDDGRTHDTVDLPRPRLSFDYVKGRPIKSNISGDSFDERLYDRDQGNGAAARVIAELRARVSP
jgi:hypothetical protein